MIGQGAAQQGRKTHRRIGAVGKVPEGRILEEPGNAVTVERSAPDGQTYIVMQVRSSGKDYVE